MLRRIGAWSSMIKIFFALIVFRVPTLRQRQQDLTILRWSEGKNHRASDQSRIGGVLSDAYIQPRMTADQIHLLRKSFGRVEEQAQVAALVFYRRLFELNPKLRALFKTDIESQAAKLMDMLGLALSLTSRPGALETELLESGKRHAGYGAREDDYATVGEALIGMLDEVLGKDFTQATRDAWLAFYAYTSETMKRGASQVSMVDGSPYGQTPANVSN